MFVGNQGSASSLGLQNNDVGYTGGRLLRAYRGKDRFSTGVRVMRKGMWVCPWTQY